MRTGRGGGRGIDGLRVRNKSVDASVLRASPVSDWRSRQASWSSLLYKVVASTYRSWELLGRTAGYAMGSPCLVYFFASRSGFFSL